MMRFAEPVPLTTRPSVSVVIPCYNYGHFLPGAVASALDQPGVDVDVLIVDDASVDDSAEVARGIARCDNRVNTLIHPSNKGHIATYRAGLERATGEYVVLLSADDLLAPGSLTRSVALMEAYPEVVLTYGYAVDFTDDPRPRASGELRNWSIWSGPDWIRRLCRRGSNVISNPEAILRTRVMRDIGGYDPMLPHAADMLLWMQAALRGSVGRVNGPDQAFYRIHGSNMHLNDQAGLITDLSQRRDVFDRLLVDEQAFRLNRAQLLFRARRAIAVEACRLGCHACDSGEALGGASGEQFAKFAVETWPRVVGTHAWRALDARMHAPAPPWRKQMTRASSRLYGAVRWRRWRRFGI